MNEIRKPDSAAVRWAARLAYCAMAPFVLVSGLLADIYGSMVRVLQIVCDAFGWDDPAIPEVAAVALTALTAFTALTATTFSVTFTDIISVLSAP